MPAYSSFAIAGAGGLGQHIAKALLKQGFQVTVLSRSSTSANAKSLSEAGATIQAVDYSDANSIAKAIAGSDVVVNTLNFETLLGDAQDTLIEQSKKAGVQLYVPNDWSFDYAFTEKNGVPTHPFNLGKVAVSAELEKIGLPYLHISTGLFGSFLPIVFSVDAAAGTAKIVGSGDTTFISTAEKDVGDFLAKVFATLPRSELENTTLRVSTSQRFTPNELFAQVQQRDGKQWKIEHAPIEEVKAAAFDPSLGMGSMLSWIHLAIDQGAANNPDNNDRVKFESSVDLVDLVLGKKSA